MMEKSLKPIFARECGPRFISGLKKLALTDERSAKDHLMRPFPGAAAIEQRPQSPLARLSIESLQRFFAIGRKMRPAKEAEAADSTIAKNLESHVSCNTCLLNVFEDVAMIGFQLGAGKQLFPGERRCVRRIDGRILGRSRLQRARVWIISFEVGCVDLHAMNRAWNPEFQDYPIVARAAPAFRFPAVAHVFRTIRHQEVPGSAIKLITGDDHAASIFHRDQIDFRARQQAGAGEGFAMNTQASDASVGVNLQTQMSKPGTVLDRKKILGITLERRFGENRDPFCFIRLQPALLAFIRVLFAEVAAFQRKPLGIVSREETGIDDDAANHPWQSESHGAPVIAGCAAAARFPSIHPFSAIGVFPFDENGVGLLDEIFLGCEKVIVGLEHSAAEAFGSEIGELSEILHRLPRRRTLPAGEAQNFPRSKIFTPRRKVASTIPIRSRPA